jgi:hypothetical protein
MNGQGGLLSGAATGCDAFADAWLAWLAKMPAPIANRINSFFI